MKERVVLFFFFQTFNTVPMAALAIASPQREAWSMPKTRPMVAIQAEGNS